MTVSTFAYYAHVQKLLPAKGVHIQTARFDFEKVHERLLHSKHLHCSLKQSELSGS